MSGLTESTLVGVPFARRRDFRCGAFLAEADCPADTVYLLGSGQVRSFVLNEDGCEATTAVLGAGQLVGLAALFGSDRHAVFVQTLTPVCAWAMPTAELADELWRNAMLLGLVVGALAQRFALAEGLLRDVLLLPVRDRVEDVQRRLAATLGGARPALNRAQLASLVQARPETLARVTSPDDSCSSCDDDAWGAGATPRRVFHAGEVLDHVEAPSGHLDVVIQGELQMTLIGADKREVSARMLRAGDFVSISGLVGLPPSGLRAVALSDGALRRFNAGEVLSWFAQDPELMANLARQLGESVVQVEHQLSCAAARTARLRLVAELREAEHRATEGAVGPTGRPLSHASLARRIGSSRETVTRTLRILEREGVIARDGRRVRLREGLPAASGGPP